MKVGGPNRSLRKSTKKTKKTKGKTLSFIEDSDSQELQNDLDSLKEELDQAFQ